MENIYTELALYGSKMLCARTDNFFSPYLRSAMVRFPLLLTIKIFFTRALIDAYISDL